jgi:DNA-binding NarL/FixJ family response regulator
MSAIRVLIADDHTLVRSGVRRLLEEIPGVEVVGEAADGARAFELAQQLLPDIAFLDLAMPGMDGLDTAYRFQRELPQVGLIILSMHASETYVLEALKAGVSGYLLKRSATEELALAIRAVSAGESFLSPAISRQVIDGYLQRDAGSPARPSITPRQREVLRLVVGGQTSRGVASKLGLSVRTVETHRAALMARLGVKDTEQLTREARRLGLVVDRPKE